MEIKWHYGLSIREPRWLAANDDNMPRHYIGDGYWHCDRWDKNIVVFSIPKQGLSFKGVEIPEVEGIRWEHISTGHDGYAMSRTIFTLRLKNDNPGPLLQWMEENQQACHRTLKFLLVYFGAI